MHNETSALQIDRPAAAGAVLPTRVLLEAIARRQCVSAIYNKARVTLAPHIVYTRHGELFVDAVAMERDGKPPREFKLGTFKLAGLGATAITSRRFDRFPGFDAADSKYSGVAIFVVEG